ncbi:hypothetical protein Acr_00g0017260 [Actinidia rufa]|uniref:Uncharacterized protein n=1 Tax=Actinidia rufa TaxID=165716 RepID=A0A7J0DB43_9ERIC|nr:hypothetical protein Acr_00g0017260 [Actinidia rufa]
MATELNELVEISGRLNFDRRVSEEELESELAESSISLSSYLDFEANFLGTEGFENASSSIAAASFAPNAKPEANLSGAKRKAVTPPTAGASELPSVGSKKKSKEEWSCAICQVSATSENGLNEHLQGKKHKSREAGLRTQRTGKNYAIGLFPKKTKPLKLVELNGNQNSQREDTDDLKTKNGDLLQKMQENIDEKKNRFKFWCEMCQVGAFSEKVLNKHRKGKKHMGRLLGLDHSGGSVRAAQVKESPQKESDPEVVAAEEIEETPDIVDQAVDGKAVDNHKAAEEVWLAVPPIDS